jgi:hypothetical protein
MRNTSRKKWRWLKIAALLLTVLLALPAFLWLQTKPWIRTTHNTIWEAAEVGDVEDLKRHLAKGAEVDAEPVSWLTGLSLFSLNDTYYVLNLLGSETPQESPLMRAAFCGQVDAVAFLLERGADPNFRLYGLHTVVGAAGLGALFDISELDTVDPQQKINFVAILRLLLNHDARFGGPNTNDSEALHALAVMGETEFLREILDSENVDPRVIDNVLKAVANTGLKGESLDLLLKHASSDEMRTHATESVTQ